MLLASGALAVLLSATSLGNHAKLVEGQFPRRFYCSKWTIKLILIANVTEQPLDPPSCHSDSYRLATRPSGLEGFMASPTRSIAL